MKVRISKWLPLPGNHVHKRRLTSLLQISDSLITSYSLADDWSQQAVFYNCCGPTEVTIVNTMHRHKAGVELTIGKPVPNTHVYILDENEQPVPIGATGSMWVGGAAVSRGYINLPELTATRYKYDQFQDDGLCSLPILIPFSV